MVEVHKFAAAKRLPYDRDSAGKPRRPTSDGEGNRRAGNDGSFEIKQDDGFVHCCRPMLDIEGIENANANRDDANDRSLAFDPGYSRISSPWNERKHEGRICAVRCRTYGFFEASMIARIGDIPLIHLRADARSMLVRNACLPRRPALSPRQATGPGVCPAWHRGRFMPPSRTHDVPIRGRRLASPQVASPERVSAGRLPVLPSSDR